MLKKFVDSVNVDDYEVLTNDGFVNINAIHKTIPYDVVECNFSNGEILRCADKHIIIDQYGSEVFVEEAFCGQNILCKDTLDNNKVSKTQLLFKSKKNDIKENMFDLELPKDSNHLYFTNNILSHNTYLAKCLAEYLFDDDDSLIRFDMSEFSEAHSVSGLIGSPPGYIGYEEAGKLTEMVRHKPYSIVLFDEIEKAHEKIFDLFLQIMDNGFLTDAHGRRCNFKNTIIIMTSNIGSKEINQYGNGLGFETSKTNKEDHEKTKSIVDKALKNKFRPEFLNRIDHIVIFNKLDKDCIEKIVVNELNKVKERVVEQGYNLVFDKSCIEFIAEVGIDKQYGARPLIRAIQTHVEEALCEDILHNKIKKEKKITVTYDKKQEKIVNKN